MPRADSSKSRTLGPPWPSGTEARSPRRDEDATPLTEAAHQIVSAWGRRAWPAVAASLCCRGTRCRGPDLAGMRLKPVLETEGIGLGHSGRVGLPEGAHGSCLI